MPELKEKEIKLDYLNEKEIIEFYELFFGNILIKKPNFPYYQNLSKCLKNETIVKSILNKLNSYEQEILKTVSRNIYLPYKFLIEKLSILLNIPPSTVKKALTNLVEKKYIFIRDDRKLIVPDVYFEKQKNKINFIEKAPENDPYFSDGLKDINNLLCYFISKEIKYSNSFSLYKREYQEVENIFSNYSTLKEEEYNIVTYFYAINFLDDSFSLILNRIKNYFAKTNLEKILYFLKITLPECFAIFNYFYTLGISAQLTLDDFKELWLTSYLLTEYENEPFKITVDEVLDFLSKINLINIEKNIVTIKYFSSSKDDFEDHIRLSSSFNFFINSESSRKDFYFPALFCDYKKYNKIVEYEITEESINRGVKHGLLFDDVINFFNSLSLKIPKNIETTLHQWFDKHASYFYSQGLHFFCQNKEKGRLISSLIEKGILKAFQIKEDEIFLIPEEEKINFFSFIEKSGIYFYEKRPIKNIAEKEMKPLNINFLFENSHNSN